MSQLLEQSLQLHLLAGNPPASCPHKELHDAAYEYWKDMWTATFKKMGAKEGLNTDHFLRQNCIAVVAKGKQVAAIHLYTIFDLTLKSHREHSYFGHHCSQKVLANLAEQGVERVMSLEYLSVHPDWRASKIGLSLATIMIANGVKLGNQWGADAVVGVARVDRGIDQMATELGARVLDIKPNLYNESFAVVGFFPRENKNASNENERRLADSLWQKRTDSTTTTLFFEHKTAKAA